MTRLPDTESRCAGRLGLEAHAPACARRHACLRHTTLLRESPNPIPPRVPVATGLCRDGSDHFMAEGAHRGEHILSDGARTNVAMAGIPVWKEK